MTDFDRYTLQWACQLAKNWIKLKQNFIKLRINENLFIYQLKEENAEFPTAVST